MTGSIRKVNATEVAADSMAKQDMRGLVGSNIQVEWTGEVRLGGHARSTSWYECRVKDYDAESDSYCIVYDCDRTSEHLQLDVLGGCREVTNTSKSPSNKRWRWRYCEDTSARSFSSMMQVAVNGACGDPREAEELVTILERALWKQKMIARGNETHDNHSGDDKTFFVFRFVSATFRDLLGRPFEGDNEGELFVRSARGVSVIRALIQRAHVRQIRWAPSFA